MDLLPDRKSPSMSIPEHIIAITPSSPQHEHALHNPSFDSHRNKPTEQPSMLHKRRTPSDTRYVRAAPCSAANHNTANAVSDRQTPCSRANIGYAGHAYPFWNVSGTDEKGWFVVFMGNADVVRGVWEDG